ncbi:MAG: N-acetylmuramoyl-L-alanine amidase [Clostridia bacterium]|nr:N-acetylmuramoyl-L-alanine amidase [Clostridia bacterium]
MKTKRGSINYDFRRTVRAAALLLAISVCALMFGGCAGQSSGSADPTHGTDNVVITPISVNIGETARPDNTADNGGATGNHTNTQAPENATATPSNGATPYYDPNSPLAGIIICVDAGHQDTGITEKEPCAPWGPEANSSVNNTVMKAKATSGTSGVSTKKPEYAVNLEIALKLRDALEAKGATVIMSRTDNSSRLSNRDRALMANENNCVLTFNIHCNGSDNQSVSGIELYVRGSGDNTSEYAARSKNEAALGQKLLDKLAESTGAKKRSVNKSDAYTGINWRDHATFIIECGFMSNPDEDANLSNPAYQDKLVSAIVRFTIEDFRG